MKISAKTFRILLLVGIFSILVSVTMEVIPSECMAICSPFLAGHKDFVINLFFGVFTGAFVGAITVYIQYVNLKFDETGQLILRLIDITNEISDYNPATLDSMEKAKKIIQIRNIDTIEIGTIIEDMHFIFDPFGRKHKCIFDKFYAALEQLKQDLQQNSKFLDLYVKGIISDDIPGIQSNIKSCESKLLVQKDETISDGRSTYTHTNYEPFFCKTMIMDIKLVLYPIGYGLKLTQQIKEYEEATTDDKT